MIKYEKLLPHELNRITPEQFKEQTKNPIALVLDNIRSGHNVGSCFRSADSFLVEKIYLCGITPKITDRELHKTALGAQEVVPSESVENTIEAVRKLRSQGYYIYAVEQTTHSTPLDKIRWSDQKVALIFGNEVKGVSEEVLNLTDATIEVPQYGTKHSLNVSVCCGIVLWEFIQRSLSK